MIKIYTTLMLSTLFACSLLANEGNSPYDVSSFDEEFSDDLGDGMPEDALNLDLETSLPTSTVNQAVWDKNADLFSRQNIKNMGKFLDMMLFGEKQSQGNSSASHDTHHHSSDHPGTSQAHNKKSMGLTVEGTQKKITDLQEKFNNEKDLHKKKKIHQQLMDSKMSLALLTGNCPVEFRLKNGFQDPKVTTYDEKNWKKLEAYMRRFSIKMLVHMALKMSKEEQDGEKARFNLMEEVWSGRYPEKYGSKKHSHMDEDTTHTSSNHNPQPPQAPLLK